MKSDSTHSESGSSDSVDKGIWRTLLNDLSGAPRYPEPGLWAFKLLPLIFGILVTIVLVVGNYDLRLQQAIYEAGGNSWEMGEHLLWKFLYRVGPYPSIVLGIAALAGLSFSWSVERFAKWRRVHLFVVLLLFLGPAVIVNFALKDNWGRPRPIHVDSLGGKQPFENVFVLNESREGKSFPCGHASTGFVLMAGYFIFCRHRRRLAYGWLILGLVFGALLGVARMLQGGHFLTDVIWVALICYYLAMWLYHLLGLKDSVAREVRRRRKMPLKVRVLMLFFTLLSIAGILLATPYRDDKRLALADGWTSETPIRFRATLATGRIEIVPSDRLEIRKKSSGHGVPTSRVAARLWETEKKDFLSAHYYERQSGWFHELNTETQIALPWNQIQSVKISNHSADVFIQLGELKKEMTLTIGPGGGVISLHVGRNRVSEGSGNLERLKGRELLNTDSVVDKGLILNVSDEFSGVIHLLE